jgi:hypothetical protein
VYKIFKMKYTVFAYSIKWEFLWKIVIHCTQSNSYDVYIGDHRAAGCAVQNEQLQKGVKFKSSKDPLVFYFVWWRPRGHKDYFQRRNYGW